MTCDLDWLGELAVWVCVAYTVLDVCVAFWRWVRGVMGR